MESSPATTQDRDENLSLRLPSGRVIGYARYGSVDSKYPTAFYLHGYPSCRLEAAIWSKKLSSSGLKVISIDRPGFGSSTPVDEPFPNRTILDHVQDIEALADDLAIDKFYVIGISGGAPYAFACAYKIPQRLLGVGILSGFGPYEVATSKKVWPHLWWVNKLGLTLPVKMPWLYERLYRLLVPWAVNHFTKDTWEEVVNSKAFKKMDPSNEDQKLMLEGGEDFYNDTVKNIREAIRQEDFARCHVEEARLLAKPWGFSLDEISTQTIKLWYGTKDINTPPQFGEVMYEALPSGSATYKSVEGGTHASVTAKGPEMFREFVGLGSEV